MSLSDKSNQRDIVKTKEKIIKKHKKLLHQYERNIAYPFATIDSEKFEMEMCRT